MYKNWLTFLGHASHSRKRKKKNLKNYYYKESEDNYVSA